jgi:exo-1,4-beta-D-glucosaminidase
MRAVALLVVVLCPAVAAADQAEKIALKDGWWAIQSSAKVTSKGEALSRAGADSTGWSKVTVPNTVVGALVENGSFPDPYFGMNLRKIPGTTYPIGERFTLLPMPKDTPNNPTWC